MYIAETIAKWFLARNKYDVDMGHGDELISNLKLQKLLYYAQGCVLAITGNILFNDDIEAWEHGPVVPTIYHLYKTFGRSGIEFDEDFDRDIIVKILDNFKSEKLSMCLDICHLQASESFMKCDISLTKEQIKRIKNIHFSMTVDNDGYRDKERTHGRVHDTLESLKKDLEYLEKKGIKLKKVNLVTEINEEDYQNRPDMIKELKLFDSIIV